MKKFLFWFFLFIVILGAVILWKSSMKKPETPKYYDADIRALIVKGYESMANADNYSYEFENDIGISKHYIKGNQGKLITLKIKDTSKSSSKATLISNLDEEKEYLLMEEDKVIFVQKPTLFDRGIQYSLGEHLKANPTASSVAPEKIEYRYEKDDVLEEKDCIVVEEETFYRADDGTYVKDNEDRFFYWIEKSTGYIVALGGIVEGNDVITPQNFIRNLSLGTVQDSDFAIPTDYKIIDRRK